MKKICDMDSVRWMPKEEITFVASNLLEDYEEHTCQAVRPPIPIEAIIERFLNLRLEYDDLKAKLRLPDILGATWIAERRIVIDRSLLDENHLGRMYFTMAHEVGHWCIHRQAFLGPAARRSWGPKIVCRESQARARGEWQADYFAAALLMPEIEVRTAFAQVFGLKPVVIHNQKSIAPKTLFWLDLAWEHADEMAGAVVDRGGFNVSKIAMRIRLEELGLLVNETGERIAVIA